MTAITSAVLFRSESKGSGFHANERPQCELDVDLRSRVWIVVRPTEND